MCSFKRKILLHSIIKQCKIRFFYEISIIKYSQKSLNFFQASFASGVCIIIHRYLVSMYYYICYRHHRIISLIGSQSDLRVLFPERPKLFLSFFHFYSVCLDRHQRQKKFALELLTKVSDIVTSKCNLASFQVHTETQSVQNVVKRQTTTSKLSLFFSVNNVNRRKQPNFIFQKKKFVVDKYDT